MFRTLRYFLAAGAVVVGASACASVKTAPASSPAAGTLPSATASTPAPSCPTGSPLPAGQGVMVDWVDMVRWNGREYDSFTDAKSAPPTAEPGPEVTRVRCSLVAADDHRHTPPRTDVDGTATYLPVGTAVYQVEGVAAECEVAAWLDGRLHVYRVSPQAAPPSCRS